MVNEKKQVCPEVAFPPTIHVSNLDTSTDGKRTIKSGYDYFAGG